MLAVQEAMSMMAQAFKGLEGTNLMLMEALVMQNIEKVSRAYQKTPDTSNRYATYIIMVPSNTLSWGCAILWFCISY